MAQRRLRVLATMPLMVGGRTGCLALVVMLGVLLGSAVTASAAGLTKARYDALDAVYTALARVEGQRVAKTLTALDGACAKLDTKDVLLNSQRQSCASTTRFLRAAQLKGCDEPSGAPASAASAADRCLVAVRQARRAAARLLTVSRSANRVIEREVSAAACRKELRSSAQDLRDNRRLIAGYRLLERAIRRGSKKDADRAERLLNSIELGDGESGFAARKRFRAACAPS
jgi:hypothetical protein